MEKKKMKMWKKILIIILILIALFVIVTVRKMIIITTLQNKMESYADKDNYYATIYEYQGRDLRINTTYRKGNTSLSTIKTLNEEVSIALTSYNDGDASHLYYETAENKFAILDGNGIPGPILIQNELKTENLWQLIVRAIKSSIETEECDGKECYRIKVGCFDLFCFDDHRIDLHYFDKETGLLVRKENGTIVDGENKINMLSDYQYEFDVVKDEDVKEPNIAEYMIQEN